MHKNASLHIFATSWIQRMKPNSAKTQSYQATRPTSANVGARLYPHQVTVEPLTGMEQCESAWSIARHSAFLAHIGLWGISSLQPFLQPAQLPS